MTFWLLFILAIALQALLIVLYQIALKVIDHYTKINDLNWVTIFSENGIDYQQHQSLSKRRYVEHPRAIRYGWIRYKEKAP